MGNGGFTIEYPPLHELATSRNPLIRRLDTFLTYLNPEPHRRSFMKPFMRQDQSAYCSAGALYGLTRTGGAAATGVSTPVRYVSNHW